MSASKKKGKSTKKKNNKNKTTNNNIQNSKKIQNEVKNESYKTDKENKNLESKKEIKESNKADKTNKKDTNKKLNETKSITKKDKDSKSKTKETKKENTSKEKNIVKETSNNKEEIKKEENFFEAIAKGHFNFSKTKESKKDIASNKEDVKKEEIKEESKKDNKDNDKKEDKKEKNLPIKSDEKPDYVKNMLRNKKLKKMALIISLVVIVLIIFISTIFAIVNINSNKIYSGISIEGIDLSNLSIEEAKEKINTQLQQKLSIDLNLYYSDEYSVVLSPEEIEFTYNIDDAIKNAYNYGKDSNIIVNNYSILGAKLFGKEIAIEYEYNEELLNEFVADVNSKIPGLVVEPSYYIEGNVLHVLKGTDGIEVASEDLKNDILYAIDTRNLEELSTENFTQTITIATHEKIANHINMEEIYNEIHSEPQDAYYTLDPYMIYASVDGIDLKDNVDTLQREVDTEDKEEYEFEIIRTAAEITLSDLGTEAFPYTISTFSTRYDASNTNRSTNLAIAAGKINGTVLMPGETFSFNQVVGKRTVEEGYKDAKIYADGAVVDGLAGGICQISSTLYNAVLLADLEIVERRNHSYTTSYLPAGKDATVVWGTTDFKFKNTRTYPIKIEATVANGVAEFTIHGMKEEVEYEISIIPTTTATIPFQTTYVQDATLAPGAQVVSQTGHTGYRVTTRKIKYLNGQEVSNEIISNDTYQSMTKIIRVGPTQ